MKIELEGDSVRIESGTGKGLTTQTMTLEQYKKHARDPEFVAAIGGAKHAEVMAAHDESQPVQAK